MEILIEELDDKYEFQDENGNYLDVCDWYGIICNQNSEVIEIQWAHEDFTIKGVVNLDFMPLSVQKVYASAQEVDVILDPSGLPPNIREIDIMYVNGNPIEFSLLPSSISRFQTDESDLEGSFDARSLPRGLLSLSMFRNRISGTIDWTALPPRISRLFMPHNSLTGTADLRHLPDTLSCLSLENNKLHGTVCLTSLPDALETLSIQRNRLTGQICFGKVYPRLISFHASQNNFSGSIHSKYMQMPTVDLDYNSLRGSINFSLFHRDGDCFINLSPEYVSRECGGFRTSSVVDLVLYR